MGLSLNIFSYFNYSIHCIIVPVYEIKYLEPTLGSLSKIIG